mgnify:CR=1 FL=1
MVESDYECDYKLYIQKKRLLKALAFIFIYQIIFLIIVFLSLNCQVINIVYLIYFLDIDLIASILTLICKNIYRSKDKGVLILSSLNIYPNVLFLIDKDEYIIGKKNELVDGWIPNQRMVSRIHAKIVRVNNRFFIIDEESLNGTYLNGKKLTKKYIKRLKIGDRIRFANVEFEVK